MSADGTNLNAQHCTKPGLLDPGGWAETTVRGRSIARRGLAKRKGGVGRKITGITKRTFKPNIQSVRAVIHGQVEGDVTASEKLELGAPARILGNIDAPRLVIAEGVIFDGDCAMGGTGAKRAVANPLGSTSDAFAGGSPKLVTVEK